MQMMSCLFYSRRSANPYSVQRFTNWGDVGPLRNQQLLNLYFAFHIVLIPECGKGFAETATAVF